jgi:hypothetical protein
MPNELALKNLTEQQRAFVRHLALTGDYFASGTKAGYLSPEDVGRRVAALPHVQEALRQEIDRLFTGRLVPLAVKALERVLTDDKANPAAVVAAAKAAFDRGGFGPQSDKAPALDAASMSTEQLRNLAGGLQAELATRAQDVTPNAPKRPVIDVDMAEILE